MNTFLIIIALLGLVAICKLLRDGRKEERLRDTLLAQLNEQNDRNRKLIERAIGRKI